jgi:hypothetical protein
MSKSALAHRSPYHSPLVELMFNACGTSPELSRTRPELSGTMPRLNAPSSWPVPLLYLTPP